MYEKKSKDLQFYLANNEVNFLPTLPDYRFYEPFVCYFIERTGRLEPNDNTKGK